MKKEIEVFLEVCKELNKKEIKPILFGSLGLSRIIGEFKKIADIDLFLKDYDNQKDIVDSVMRELGFILQKDYVRDNIIISFGPLSCLQVEEECQETTEDNASFYELPAESYLSFYQRMLLDPEREKRKGDEDRRKIELIKKYLNETITSYQQ